MTVNGHFRFFGSTGEAEYAHDLCQHAHALGLAEGRAEAKSPTVTELPPSVTIGGVEYRRVEAATAPTPPPWQPPTKAETVRFFRKWDGTMSPQIRFGAAWATKFKCGEYVDSAVFHEKDDARALQLALERSV